MRKVAQDNPDHIGQTAPATKRKREPAPTTAQMAVTALQKMIEEEQLAPSAPLPPQRELAKELDVSRATLREALSILATIGLVSIEPGRGTFVRAKNDAGELTPAPSWRFAARYSPAEVYQFRYIAESHAAQLAAMNQPHRCRDRGIAGEPAKLPPRRARARFRRLRADRFRVPQAHHALLAQPAARRHA